MSDPGTTTSATGPSSPEGEGAVWAAQVASLTTSVRKSPYAAVLVVGPLLVARRSCAKLGASRLGMTPAFVKRVAPTDGGGRREARDVLVSRQLVRFEDSPETSPVGSGRGSTIRADHRRADDVAMDKGRSRQIELPDSYVGSDLFPEVVVKEEVGQPVFRPVTWARGAHEPLGEALNEIARPPAPCPAS